MDFKKEFAEFLTPITIGTLSNGTDDNYDPSYNWETLYETAGAKELRRSTTIDDLDESSYNYRFFLPRRDDEGDLIEIAPENRTSDLYIVEKEDFSYNSDKDDVEFYLIGDADPIHDWCIEAYAKTTSL